MRTLQDIDVANKRVLVRCDFNIPLSEQGDILDDFRLKATLPTIEYLIKNKAKTILMSHLGRPGQTHYFRKSHFRKFGLEPIALRLEELLRKRVRFLNDCIGEEVQKEIEKMRIEEVLLLENLRFYKEEEENDPEFAKELAKLGDIFVNDAFGASHRAHASIVGITKHLPSAAGLLLEKEIKILTGLMKNPQKPLVAIIAGKKVETKTKVIDKISEKADWILIGGLLQKELEEKNIFLKFPEKLISPIDGSDFDIGPKTIELFKEKISLARTIFWNGPLGKIEDENYSKGTAEIAKAIVKSGAVSIVGGGETVEFINKLGLGERFSHLSTGGGAMLEFLSGEKLPGLEALLTPGVDTGCR